MIATSAPVGLPATTPRLGGPAGTRRLVGAVRRSMACTIARLPTLRWSAMTPAGDSRSRSASRGRTSPATPLAATRTGHLESADSSERPRPGVRIRVTGATHRYPLRLLGRYAVGTSDRRTHSGKVFTRQMSPKGKPLGKDLGGGPVLLAIGHVGSGSTLRNQAMNPSLGSLYSLQLGSQLLCGDTHISDLRACMRSRPTVHPKTTRGQPAPNPARAYVAFPYAALHQHEPAVDELQHAQPGQLATVARSASHRRRGGRRPRPMPRLIAIMPRLELVGHRTGPLDGRCNTRAAETVRARSSPQRRLHRRP